MAGSTLPIIESRPRSLHALLLLLRNSNEKKRGLQQLKRCFLLLLLLLLLLLKVVEWVGVGLPLLIWWRW